MNPNATTKPDAAKPDEPITPRVIATDTAGATQDSGDETTTAARHAAYHAAHQWQGKPLQAYSFQREALFNITRRFLPLGGLSLPEEYDADYVAEVALLLFLCSSMPEDLQVIRHSADTIINKAFEWAETNLPRDQREAAGKLAFLILKEANINTAVPRPDGKEIKAGN